MDLDALLANYFGTADLASLDDAAFADGVDRLAIAFATETEPGRRFALWALLHGIGEAPDPAIAFKDDPRTRDAAITYARLADRAGD
ncbi:hypothetical protein [Sphingomonas fennica]|uniref:Uncharacterized protein n=1 Tax=Edaphosphingomonas fennica TaxID=114404 RepID=A0A2T4HP67_9SPHN|nr:hypothetical protein [Sphingomonas fennica]PTD17566.1 hypothetical protein CV103_17405 [Sphingomonas fennica]